VFGYPYKFGDTGFDTVVHLTSASVAKLQSGKKGKDKQEKIPSFNYIIEVSCEDIKSQETVVFFRDQLQSSFHQGQFKSTDIEVRRINAWTLEIVSRSDSEWKHRLHFKDSLATDRFMQAVKNPIQDEVSYWSDDFGSFQCSSCAQNFPLSQCFVLDNFGDSRTVHPSLVEKFKLDNAEGSVFCKRCCSERITKLINDGNILLNDSEDFLSRQDHVLVLDLLAKSFVTKLDKVITCPKCSVSFESDLHSFLTEEMALIEAKARFERERGMDMRKLSKKAKELFIKYRFKCINRTTCSTDFCVLCREFPYHYGLDCDEYQEFKIAPKCRFCENAVTSKTTNKKNFTAFPVCDSKACDDAMNAACHKKANCGKHPCLGFKGELQCPTCIYPECTQSGTTYQDSCAICMTDELRASAIVQVECGHFFHVACTRKKIQTGYNGARISFEFQNCPLCNAKIRHPVLDAHTEKIDKLEKIIAAKALERLKFEGLDKCEEILNPESRFYMQPREYAMHHFAFYMCFTVPPSFCLSMLNLLQCNTPYFAGAYECQAAGAEEINRKELKCSRCQEEEKSVHFVACAKHGSEWMMYKCRYCCSVAVWHCFGTTHFCDAWCSFLIFFHFSNSFCSHRGDVWPKLSDGNKNIMKIWQYPQCQGTRTAFANIGNSKLHDMSDAQLSAILSDPRSCPLKAAHPPNGVEFFLGCGLCTQQDVKKFDVDAAAAEIVDETNARFFLRSHRPELERFVSSSGFHLVVSELDDSDQPVYFQTHRFASGSHYMELTFLETVHSEPVDEKDHENYLNIKDICFGLTPNAVNHPIPTFGYWLGSGTYWRREDATGAIDSASLNEPPLQKGDRVGILMDLNSKSIKLFRNGFQVSNSLSVRSIVDSETLGAFKFHVFCPINSKFIVSNAIENVSAVDLSGVQITFLLDTKNVPPFTECNYVDYDSSLKGWKTQLQGYTNILLRVPARLIPRNYLNHYTIILDLYVESLPVKDELYASVIQLCKDDLPALYLTSQGVLGVCGVFEQQTAQLATQKWYRIAIVGQLPRIVKFYIDGVLAFQNPHELDHEGRFAVCMDDGFTLFGSSANVDWGTAKLCVRRVEIDAQKLSPKVKIFNLNFWF
jgi:hypothetical protein